MYAPLAERGATGEGDGSGGRGAGGSGRPRLDRRRRNPKAPAPYPAAAAAAAAGAARLGAGAVRGAAAGAGARGPHVVAGGGGSGGGRGAPTTWHGVGTLAAAAELVRHAGVSGAGGGGGGGDHGAARDGVIDGSPKAPSVSFAGENACGGGWTIGLSCLGRMYFASNAVFPDHRYTLRHVSDMLICVWLVLLRFVFVWMVCMDVVLCYCCPADRWRVGLRCGGLFLPEKRGPHDHFLLRHERHEAMKAFPQLRRALSFLFNVHFVSWPRAFYAKVNALVECGVSASLGTITIPSWRRSSGKGSLRAKGGCVFLRLPMDLTCGFLV